MGYDAGFLGIEVAMPGVAGGGGGGTDGGGADGVAVLDYAHFTVALDRSRRFAQMTAVNIDGAALVELERGGERWRLDERIPADWQAGAAIYADNDLDRGHLVRRRDPVWGDAATVEQANADTFHYTNAAPQAAGFNQSRELWLGLEEHVLAYADANRLRLDVFTAPVLDADDPPYRGIQVPLRFFKIVAWAAGDELAAAGFVLDQSPLVDTERIRPAVPGEPPPLGPFRTFQVPIAAIAALSGVEMAQLVAADRMPRTAARAGWRLLEASEEILL